MREAVGWFQAAFAGVGGVVGSMLGGWDGFLYTLVTFVVIDYLTGVIAAAKQKHLSSEIGFIGILKKVAIFFMVAMANVLDQAIEGDPGVLRTAVIFFYVSNEGLSILENISNIGLPVPKKLKAVLEQLRKDDDEIEEEDPGEDDPGVL